MIIKFDELISALQGDKKELIFNKADLLLKDIRIDYAGIKESDIIGQNFTNTIQIERIESRTPKDLIFKECHFKSIEIGQLDNINLKFLNCKLDNIIFKGIIDKVEIRGSSINTVKLVSGRINRLVISGEKPYEKLIVENADFDLRRVINFYLLTAEIEKLSISRIEVNNNPYINRHHEFDNLVTNYLSFTKVQNGNNLFIKRISAKDKNSEFSVLHSNLANAIIQDSNFKNFRCLKVKNSHFEEIVSKNTHWFKRIVNWDNEEDIISYRQLKAAMLKQHDKVSEIYFRAKEMDAYLKWLKFRENKGEWLLLQANKYSNGHGMSWIQGLKFTFCVTLFFFILYLWSLNEYLYTFGWQDIKTMSAATIEFIGYFSRFFIITHDFDFMNTFKPNGISYLIDVFGRIIIGYGIYQTVQAFRKYGRG